MLSLRPRTAAFTLASALALALAADVLWMPVQASDSLDEILDAQASPSAWASFADSLRSDAEHVRPLRVAQTKVLYDLAGRLRPAGVGGPSGQHYWLVYRGFHAALIVTALLLFTAAQRVSTPIDFAASAFALVVLVGMRTFRGNVQEAFPVNHFLEIAVFCLLTLNLARSRACVWTDLGAVLAFVAATLTLESGLLVWVIAVGAWIVGWRGISMRGIAVMTLLAAGYAYLRFVHLSSDASGLPDRSTGFLLTMLEPAELQQRFGDRPAVLYAYNVAAAALSVLFSEPSNGVFLTIRAWLSGEIPPRLAIPVLTSIATTAVIIWAAIRGHRSEARGHRSQADVSDDGRLIVLFAVVLAANSALSYSYTKDEILGIAGAFYALAAFVAIRAILHRVERAPASAKGFGGQARAAAVMAVVVVLTVGWTVRAAGLHYVLRSQAFKHQNDWVELPGEWRRNGRWPADPAAQRLIRTLHDAAVTMEVPNAQVGELPWVARLWED